jgi:class I fructose-bisphosphate aldolase
MTSVGVQLRMNSLTRRGKAFVVALDHGLFGGVPEDLEDVRKKVEHLPFEHIDGLVLSPGQLEMFVHNSPQALSIPVVLRGDAVSTWSGEGVSVTSAIISSQRALSLGATALLVMGVVQEGSNLELFQRLGQLKDEAYGLGLPLIVEHLPQPGVSIVTACRVLSEVGVDGLKIPIPEDLRELDEVLKVVELPIFLAGGEKLVSEERLLNVERVCSDGHERHYLWAQYLEEKRSLSDLSENESINA